LNPEDFHIQPVIHLLREAGAQIMEYYTKGEYHYDSKHDHSPVTSADLDSDKLITEGLNHFFPDIPVVSEESGAHDYDVRKHSKILWLLDPLDGTREFMTRTGDFSINLALIENQKPVLGFVYLPVTEEIYVGISGHGSYMLNSFGEKTSLTVNKFSLNSPGIRMIKSRHQTDTKTDEYISSFDKPDIQEMGGALKFLSIARGDADYYPRMSHIMEWDIAAGQVIIEEAGGKLVDMESGLPLTYNKPALKCPYFIASGQISEDVAEI
jgi:3'(2'), 5'-bisphosphate nucleotidase